jgi:hypothetical protein
MPVNAAQNCLSSIDAELEAVQAAVWRIRGSKASRTVRLRPAIEW